MTLATANLAHQLRLVCHECRWIPATHKTMGLVAAHFETEHPETAITLDLVLICCDNVEMDLVAERPTGGGAKQWFRCPTCGREGFVKQNQEGRR